MAWAAKGGVCRAKSPENPEEIKNFNEMQDGGRGWLVRSECELAGRNKAGDEGDVRAIRRWVDAGKHSFHSEPSSGL
jgi:hypothetical protein